MSNFNTEIIPPHDNAVIAAFKELALNLKQDTKIGLGRVNITFGIIPPKDIDIETFFESDEYKTVAESNVEIIEQLRIFIPTDSAYISFIRQSQKATSKLQIDGSSPVLTNLNFNNFIYKCRRSLKPINSLPSSVLDQEIISSIQRDLSSTTILLKEDIYRTKRNYEKELEAERLRLTTEFKSKNEEFNELVHKKNTELQEKENEIDRINNTDARRKIRTDLNKEIEKRIESFGPSKLIMLEYRQLNITFQFILILLATVSTLMILMVINKIIFDKTESVGMIYASLESGALILATVSFFIYYSRWKSQWINKLTEEEFLLKKYRLDIDRSSWIIESYLEFEVSHNKELPDSIVSPITSNLFESRNSVTHNTKHPVEDLLGFITKNSRLKIRAGENEVEFEKGLKP